MGTKLNFAVLTLALAAAPVSAQTRTHTRADIPPGHLPPKGMCRVWIDGVPPGQQPPVTTCSAALANRVANSRVIFGDRASFPGRGTGKFREEISNGDVGRTCTAFDAIVVDGRLVKVCRDDIIVRDKRGRKIRREDLDRDDDNDKIEKREKDGRVKVKGIKASKKGKRGN
jgi:hypothetical protein